MDDIPSSLQNIVQNKKSIKEIGIDKDLAKFGDTVTNFIYSLAKSVVLGKLDQRKVSRLILSAALKQSDMKKFAKTRSDAHGLADTTEALIGYTYCIGWSLESMAEVLIETLKNYDLNDFKIEKLGAIKAFTHLLLKIKSHLLTIFSS
ncbi:ribonuclease III family protein [Promethearchaeum syntrophicum]|uniref:Ribonuclease III family protein n=1 Tax=Promethearchaeum syntrophicum TaxID=2594042 RepID=A0A5B9D5J0_9ARCH|nr:ribonuclease III family protein [Candidatus Prometheoarchaeum syntrophicum]QEE14256.1 hypothetical protein DSAG12_00067 [Candidatus Prometheoarchaeum syntrophicum]